MDPAGEDDPVGSVTNEKLNEDCKALPVFGVSSEPECSDAGPFRNENKDGVKGGMGGEVS